MNSFSVKIATPDGLVYEGEVLSFRARTVTGDVEILAGHTDYLALLSTGAAHLTLPDGTVRLAALSGGVMTVRGGTLSVAATTLEFAEEIDKSRASRAKERAENALREAKDDRSLRLAKAKLERALLRLQVAAYTDR